MESKIGADAPIVLCFLSVKQVARRHKTKLKGGLTSCMVRYILQGMSEIRLQVSNLLSYSEAARMLGVTRVTVYAIIARGELHPLAIADRRYLLREEVERLKNQRK